MGVSAAKLQVAGLEPESIVDGPGIRLAVFVQGCPHKCPAAITPRPTPLRGARKWR